MAENFGNGVGLLYSTKIDGITFIDSGTDNNKAGANKMKADALNVAPIGTTVKAVGIIEIAAVAVSGALTSLTINGVQQIDIGAPPALTAGAAMSVSATAVATAVNAHVAAAGENYIAQSSGGFVYLYTANNVGSSVNGHVVTGINTGTATINYTNMANGANGNEAYSQLNGIRFWINATAGATVGSLVGATEITPKLVMRGSQLGYPISSLAINADLALATVVRTGNTQQIAVNVGAPTVLEYIPTNNAVLGDILYLYADNFEVTVTDQSVAAQGNFMLTNQLSFVSSDVEELIAVRLIDHSTNGLMWAEIARSIIGIAAGAVGTTELAALSVTTTELAALSVTTAKIAANAVTTTEIAANTIQAGDIAGNTITATEIAPQTIDTTELALLSVDNSVLDDDAVTTVKILDANVTLAKLEASLLVESFTMPISWETGEQGIIKRKIPYDFTVTECFLTITKDVAGTDDATLIFKNDAGTAFTGAQIDVTAGVPLGNDFTSTPSANNTFLAGETMWFETIKTTPGGKGVVTVCGTR